MCIAISPEEFFTLCTLRFGNPDTKVMTYQSTTVRYWPKYRGGRGPSWWCKETPEGREFVKFVNECGEAMIRAPMWYRRWFDWHRRNKTLETPDG